MFQKVLKVQIWLSRLCQWLKIGKYIFYIYILHIYIHIYMCVPCIMLWCWKHFKDGSLKRRFCCQAQMVIRGTVFGTWTLASFSAHEIAVWCNYSQCEFSTKSDRKGKTMGVCFKETLEMDTCCCCVLGFQNPADVTLNTAPDSLLSHLLQLITSDRALLAKQTALETVGMEWNFPLTTSLALWSWLV